MKNIETASMTSIPTNIVITIIVAADIRRGGPGSEGGTGEVMGAAHRTSPRRVTA